VGGVVVKAVIAIIAAGIAAFYIYAWTHPTPSPYADFPPALRKELEATDKQVKEDMAGDLGQGARALCRARLGIKEPVQTGMDLIKRGSGAKAAEAFDQCVVDLMYPIPEETRKKYENVQ
jgi:hypothetical protein